MNDSNNRKAFYGFQIPKDWRLEKLGTFGETFTGLSGKTKEDFGSGKPYIPYLNIFNNAIIRDGDFDFVNIGEDETQSLVKNGDLFFTTSSETPEEVGMCSVYLGNESELYLNSFCFGFRANSEDDISTEFTAQLFRSALGRRIIYKLAQGATRYNISKTNLLLEEIPFPPLPEQKAIAQVLSTADAAIHTTENIRAQKELRKKWLMQQLLTGKKRLKGYNEEWKEIHIRDVAKEVSIRNKSNKQLTVLSCTKYDGLVPSLEYFGRKIFADDVSTYKIVPKNHFAYATNHIEEGSIGYQVILDEALISPMYTVFKTDITINDDFFYRLLKSHPLVYQYQNRMEGSIDRRGGLRWDGFSIIKIKLPSYEEQTAIAQVLQAADKEISLLKAKAERLREQKKGLMQVLLTGKVRLKINE